MTKRNSPKSAKTKKAVPTKQRAATPTARLAGTEQKSPIQEVVGTIFQNDSIVRKAIAENLKERSTAGKAFTTRAHQAFASFNPSKHSADEPVRRNYLKPGDSLAPKQKGVITRGLDAFRNSTTTRSLKLSKSPELDKLIQAAPENDDSIHGTIALSDLISHIEAKFIRSVGRDTVIASCKAEIEAEKRIKEIMGLTPAVAGSSAADTDPRKSPDKNQEEPGSAASLISSKLVRENVDLQMDTVTSPESELLYSIPAHSDKMKDKHDIPTFELRKGASDVTSFHDFHNLQIAFEDVWTEMFDDQLTVLGKQLYEEYVRLKDFSGVDDGRDHTINTIDDLRHLMDEIRDFSRLTVASVPPEFQPSPGPDGTPPNTTGNVVGNVVKMVRDIVDPVGWLINAIANGLGQADVLTWDSFKTPLSLGDIITVSVTPERIAKLGPQIEIVLQTPPPSVGFKGLIFVDRFNGKLEVQARVDRKDVSMFIAGSLIKGGFLEFRKKTFGETVNGVHVLGLDEINPGERVTFTWSNNT